MENQNLSVVEKVKSIVDYNVTAAYLAKIVEDSKTISFNDTSSYKAGAKFIANLRTLRLGIEEKRLSIKKEVIALIDDEAKIIQEVINPIEDKLKADKKIVDDEKARIKAEAEEKERKRVAEIRAAIDSIRSHSMELPAMTMPQLEEVEVKLSQIVISQEFYQEFTAEARIAFEAVNSNLEAAMVAREIYDNEQAAQEKRRLWLDEQRKKADERIKAESERVAKEQAALEAEKAEFEKQKAEFAKQQAALNPAPEPIAEPEAIEGFEDDPAPLEIKADDMAKVKEVVSGEQKAEILTVPVPEKKAEEITPKRHLSPVHTAPSYKRPTDKELIAGLAIFFKVPENIATHWILEVQQNLLKEAIRN